MPRRRIAIAVAIAVGVVALVVAANFATASPALCGSCHEMGARTASWKQSAHAGVKCVKCHTAPHEWYALPQAAISRGSLLGRDLGAHLSGNYTDPVDGPVEGVEPMGDEVCLQCHDPNRKATSGFRIKIDHAEHAKRNDSCISCHVNTAHPVATRGTPLSLMAQCYTCHGTGEDAKAPANCDLCHPTGYQLLPVSHKDDAEWKTGHAPVAKADPKQCEMCHEQSFCDDCHGVKMPHPKGWAQGATGHAIYAKRDREICAKCHEEKPDLCSMCHHKAYDPTKGNWVKQHYEEVTKKGSAFCMECHSPLFCVRCHVGSPAAGP